MRYLDPTEIYSVSGANTMDAIVVAPFALFTTLAIGTGATFLAVLASSVVIKDSYEQNKSANDILIDTLLHIGQGPEIGYSIGSSIIEAAYYW